jgi:lipopolysaccharide assembly outer membrane protein LptD (OstA)
MSRTQVMILAAALLLAFLTLCRPCQAGKAPSSAGNKGGEAAKKPDEIHMTADKLSYDEKKKFARLIKNVRITYKDVVMTSDRGDFDGEKKIGHFTGGVKIWQPGTVITADRLDAFYSDKKAVLTGHVRAIMESKPKKGSKEEAPPPQKDKKEDQEDQTPTIMTCEYIEFFWEAREGYAKNNVKIWKKEKTAYADTVHYSQNAGLITMSGNVRFERSKKDWMICPEAYFDMKTETFVARGGVEGNVEMQKEQKKKEEKPVDEDRLIVPPLTPLYDEVFEMPR